MESAGSKLNILFSPGFLANMCDQIEKARLSKNDYTFNAYYTVNQNLFGFSSERNIKLINGREISEEMFKKVFL